MDPVSIFGLAAGVAQFVMFASQLFSQALDIHTSGSSLTAEATTCEEVYRQLSDLCLKLDTTTSEGQPATSEDGAIKTLALQCWSDCQSLIQAIGKLDPGKRKSPWKSLQSAWRSILGGEKKIRDLQKRLHETQTVLILHICAMAERWHSSHENQLENLRTESASLHLQQAMKLDQIADGLTQLGDQIGMASYDPEGKGHLVLDVSSLEQEMNQLSLANETAAKEQSILKSLRFPTRQERHSAISKAHARTFRWIFESQDAGDAHDYLVSQKAAKLRKWLEGGTGLFWVSGKPGSGKSTLMKFVTGSENLIPALSKWASPKKAVTAAHYFWNAGEDMQKSQEGLLQSLLYEMFRQCPELIQSACASRWSWDSRKRAEQGWQISELYDVLSYVATVPTLSTKFCLFIDGLDEYDGDHIELCAALQKLSQSTHVKICVSSRPWNVFEYAFSQDDQTKIYIHELTRGDIRRFVQYGIQDHPRWPRLDSDTRTGPFHRLVDEVTEKAQGVFLWVLLVTNLLRKGLTNSDTIADLRKRVEGLPAELENFFKKIVESVELCYHQKMATTFQVTLRAKRPLPVLLYHYHDVEHDNPNYALRLDTRPLSGDDLQSLISQTSSRLNGRFQGLLEVNEETRAVNFLHRTVRDFLTTRDMAIYLARKETPGFNPSLSILRAYIAFIKSTRFPEPVHRLGYGFYKFSTFTDTASEVFRYAADIGEGAGHDADCAALLDDLERALPIMKASQQLLTTHAADSTSWFDPFFREHLVNAGLVGYLRAKLLVQPTYLSNMPQPLTLFLISERAEPHLGRWRPKGPEMLHCVAQAGQCLDANLIFGEGTWETPWTILTAQITQLQQEDEYQPGSSWLDVGFFPVVRTGLLSAMLAIGADPNALVNFEGRYTPAWECYVFLAFHVPADPESMSLYLEGLDQVLSFNVDWTSNQGVEGPAYQRFLSRLADKYTVFRAFGVNWGVLGKVLERLLEGFSRVGVPLSIDGHWPVLRTNLGHLACEKLEAICRKAERNWHLAPAMDDPNSATPQPPSDALFPDDDVQPDGDDEASVHREVSLATSEASTMTFGDPV